MEKERCFACDRPLTLDHKHATTSDGQRVFVGANCFKLIKKAGETGYQPPKGGPRLYLLTK